MLMVSYLPWFYPLPTFQNTKGKGIGVIKVSVTKFFSGKMHFASKVSVHGTEHVLFILVVHTGPACSSN